MAGILRAIATPPESDVDSRIFLPVVRRRSQCSERGAGFRARSRRGANAPVSGRLFLRVGTLRWRRSEKGEKANNNFPFPLDIDIRDEHKGNVQGASTRIGSSQADAGYS